MSDETIDESNIASTATSNDLAETISLMENHLSCPICFCIFETPISLPCGHTFCRTCIRRALEVKYICPSCRSPTPHGIWLSDENIVIKRFCAHLATLPGTGTVITPSQTTTINGQEQSKTVDSDCISSSINDGRRLHSSNDVHTWSLFQIPMLAFPGQPGVLNIFESRYLLLLDRALFGDRMFVIHESGRRGSLGILVRIDGEIVEGRYRGQRRVARVPIVGSKRVKFVYDAVESGNQEDQLLRLKTCHVRIVEDLENDPYIMEESLSPETKSKLSTLRQMTSILLPHLDAHDKVFIRNAYGECPSGSHQWQALTFWLSSSVRMSLIKKDECFSTRSAISRLNIVYAAVKSRDDLKPLLDLLLNNEAINFDNQQMSIFASNLFDTPGMHSTHKLVRWIQSYQWGVGICIVAVVLFSLSAQITELPDQIQKVMNDVWIW